MAFWKVYKYRSKNRYMYDWIWWYRTIGQYPKEQWDTIKEKLKQERRTREKEGRRALNHFIGLATFLNINGKCNRRHMQTLLELQKYLEGE